MKKLIFSLSLFITLFSVQSFAQNNLVLYNMKNIPQTIYTNPAYIPKGTVNVSLPIISSIYFNAGNSGFAYSDIVRHDGDSLYVDTDNFLSKLATNNYLGIAFETDLIGASWISREKNFWSVNITEKVQARLRYPSDFFQLAVKGNGGMLGETVDFNFGVDMLHYREHGLGYARMLTKKLTIGARFKYLYGYESIKTEKSDISLYTDPNYFALTAKSDLMLRTAGLDTGRSVIYAGYHDVSPSQYFIQKNNNGFALDLGAHYKISDKISVHGSIVDLGFINWKTEVVSIGSVNPGATFTYEGLDIYKFIKRDTLSITEAFEEVGDSVRSSFDLQQTYGGKFKTKLVTQFYLGGNYFITDDEYAGLLFWGRYLDGKLQPSYTLSYTSRIKGWFSSTASWSYLNRSFNNIGLGITLNLYALQFYIVSDNVLGMVFPQNTRNINIRTGINITSGLRAQDTDEDGLVDDKDQCPDIPGLKQFNGCPDRDGDNIIDKDDQCPDNPGLIDFHGCPDKDGDKVTDNDDKCPDDAGPVESGGCPDKDGDKIIDKYDDCPDVKGLETLKGCPDKDEDGIKDSEDKCPDEPGIATFRGCPDKDSDGVQDKDDKCPDKAGLPELKGCPEDKLFVLDKNGNVIASAVKGSDGFFKFESLPTDQEYTFKHDGEDVDVTTLQIMIGGKKNKITKTAGGFFKFELLPGQEGEGMKQEDIEEVGMAVTLKKEEQEILKRAFDNLEFNPTKDVIRPESLKSLEELALLMVKKPSWKIVLSGHTDNVGNAKTNMELSRKRAEAVGKYLETHGVDKTRIFVQYFGGTKPITDNKTAEGRQHNRRVEMKIME